LKATSHRLAAAGEPLAGFELERPMVAGPFLHDVHRHLMKCGIADNGSLYFELVSRTGDRCDLTDHEQVGTTDHGVDT